MKKSARLAAITKIEEAKEHAEARKLSECRKAAHEKKAKLRELEEFLGEYNERFMQLTRSGAQAEKIRSSHAFLGQLNSAILQQRKAVLEAERAAEEYREQWMLAKRRVDILQKAVDKLHVQELQHEQRKEQLIIDELARHKPRDL